MYYVQALYKNVEVTKTLLIRGLGWETIIADILMEKILRIMYELCRKMSKWLKYYWFFA